MNSGLPVRDSVPVACLDMPPITSVLMSVAQTLHSLNKPFYMLTVLPLCVSTLKMFIVSCVEKYIVAIIMTNVLGPVVTLFTTMFNVQKVYLLTTQCIYVFCFVCRTEDEFPMQH